MAPAFGCKKECDPLPWAHFPKGFSNRRSTSSISASVNTGLAGLDYPLSPRALRERAGIGWRTDLRPSMKMDDHRLLEMVQWTQPNRGEQTSRTAVARPTHQYRAGTAGAYQQEKEEPGIARESNRRRQDLDELDKEEQQIRNEKKFQAKLKCPVFRARSAIFLRRRSFSG